MSNTDYKNWLYNIMLADVQGDTYDQKVVITLKQNREFDEGRYIPAGTVIATYDYTDELEDEALEYVVDCIRGGNISRLDHPTLAEMQRNAVEFEDED